MAENCDGLLDRAKRKRASITFPELCRLAECFGFVFDRQKSSHYIYERPGTRPMDFQPRKRDEKMAKPYQVKQLLDFIATLPENEDHGSSL